MGLQKIQLQIVPEDQFPQNSNIIMSQSVAQALGIKTQPIWVTYGSAADTGYLSLHSHPSNLIRIKAPLAKKLHLTDQLAIYTKFDLKAMSLQFGPLVGILINTLPNQKQEHLFGPLTKFLDECVAAGKTRGTQIAIFQAEHIDLEKRRITTAWIKQKGKWIKTTIPYPDMIYNRINSRRIEEQTEIQTKLRRLIDYHRIPLFNERFLDKWQVHEILQQDKSIRHMLPHTIPYELKQIKKMLSEYTCLYLKPTNGSLGGGIIRLTKVHKSYLFQYATLNGTNSRTTTSFIELSKMLTRQIGKNPYLIQQGLNLVTFENRPIDFRVLIQKNSKGKWSVTSAVARIANDRHIVSNLARGGTLRKVPEVLKELHLAKKPTSLQIQHTAINVAEVFEKHAKGHFAELGVDLALDTKGQIWLLEINSKPSKTDDSVLNQNSSIRPSVNKLFDYVHFLAGIKPTRRRRR